MISHDVLIIGCGSIGALKDNKYDSVNGKNILTLAHAFHKHPLTKSIHFYDNDIEKAKQAAIKWYGSYYLNLEEAISSSQPSIIIVATPTQFHYDTLWKIMEFIDRVTYKPKLIICEKPFCTDYAQALIIHNSYNVRQIPIMIDYSRRFDPIIQNFREQLLNYLPIYSLVLTYTRGFKRDASHGIDLCNFFFGNFKQGVILDSGIVDFSPDDLTYSAHLSYELCNNVFLSPVDGRDYDIFDINIYCKGMRFNFVDHGKTFIQYEAIEETTYGNYKSMPSESKCKTYTQLTNTLYLLAENAYDYISMNKNLLCTSADGLKVHKVFVEVKYK